MDEIHDMGDMSKLVYICSKHKGTPSENKFFDDQYFWLANDGENTPVVPYLMLSSLYEDGKSSRHKTGRRIAKKLLSKCDELWIMWDRGLDEEMVEDISLALKHGIPIRNKSIEITDTQPDDVELTQWGLPAMLNEEANE